jgi:hypothetical protein
MVDESLSAEDDFQRQLENDARLLSLQMEAACTRIQASRAARARLGTGRRDRRQRPGPGHHGNDPAPAVTQETPAFRPLGSTAWLCGPPNERTSE